MDNVSRISIVSPYDTAIDESIYFSFNTTVGDKTLEVENTHLNMYDEDKENLKTVIKKSTGQTPLRTVSKSILQEFKVFSSTPTRKLCMEEIEHGMVALGVAPLKDDSTEKNQREEASVLETQSNGKAEHDKGGSESDSKEDPFLNNNKTIEENTEKEKDINGIQTSNIPSIVIVDTSINISEQYSNYDEKNGSTLKFADKTNNELDKSLKNKSTNLESSVPIIVISDSYSESELPDKDEHVKNIKIEPTSKKLVTASRGTTPRKNVNKNEGEKGVSLINKRLSSIPIRRSVLPSEPDLMRNKPSRIAEKKRVSLATTSKQNPSVLPMNKRLSTIKQTLATVIERSPKKSRKSIILKTTLNSSASMRRNVRKTLGPSTSVVGSKKNEDNVLPAVRKNNIQLRRSMFPNAADDKILIQNNQRTVQPKLIAPIIGQDFSCEKCHRAFRLLSSLEAHKKTHIKALVSTPICKFCDKKFAISKALENHLLEKCHKIPTGERKKLLAPPAPVSENSPKRGSLFKKSSQTIAPVSSCSIDSTTSIQKGGHLRTDTERMPPPLSSSKAKKKKQTPHSGVYRTPSKPVVCHPCKKTFNNILNFTEHVLSHSSSGPDS